MRHPTSRGQWLWSDVPGLNEAFHKAIAERMTARQISEHLSNEFNITITRNAVIGRSHRLKLKIGGGQSKPKAGAKKMRQTVAKAPPPSIAPIMLEMFDKAPANPAEPAKRGVTFAKLTDNMCRWIEGEPSPTAACYCGEARFQAVIGKIRNPYCFEHYRRAYGGRNIAYTQEQIAQFKRNTAHMKSLARAR